MQVLVDDQFYLLLYNTVRPLIDCCMVLGLLCYSYVDRNKFIYKENYKFIGLLMAVNDCLFLYIFSHILPLNIKGNT